MRVCQACKTANEPLATACANCSAPLSENDHHIVVEPAFIDDIPSLEEAARFQDDFGVYPEQAMAPAAPQPAVPSEPVSAAAETAAPPMPEVPRPVPVTKSFIAAETVIAPGPIIEPQPVATPEATAAPEITAQQKYTGSWKTPGSSSELVRPPEPFATPASLAASTPVAAPEPVAAPAPVAAPGPVSAPAPVVAPRPIEARESSAAAPRNLPGRAKPKGVAKLFSAASALWRREVSVSVSSPQSQNPIRASDPATRGLIAEAPSANERSADAPVSIDSSTFAEADSPQVHDEPPGYVPVQATAPETSAPMSDEPVEYSALDAEPIFADVESHPDLTTPEASEPAIAAPADREPEVREAIAETSALEPTTLRLADAAPPTLEPPNDFEPIETRSGDDAEPHWEESSHHEPVAIEAKAVPPNAQRRPSLARFRQAAPVEAVPSASGEYDEAQPDEVAATAAATPPLEPPQAGDVPLLGALEVDNHEADVPRAPASAIRPYAPGAATTRTPISRRNVAIAAVLALACAALIAIVPIVNAMRKGSAGPGAVAVAPAAAGSGAPELTTPAAAGPALEAPQPSAVPSPQKQGKQHHVAIAQHKPKPAAAVHPKPKPSAKPKSKPAAAPTHAPTPEIKRKPIAGLLKPIAFHHHRRAHLTPPSSPGLPASSVSPASPVIANGPQSRRIAAAPAASAVQAPAQTPLVVRSSLGRSSTVSLATGAAGGLADLQWHKLSADQWQLLTVNGAAAHRLGPVGYSAFFAITANDLAHYSYAPIALPSISGSDLNGTVFAVRTSGGAYAKVYVQESKYATTLYYNLYPAGSSK